MNNFRDKLNFTKKTIVFVEKEYTLKTDHKTGLLLQELQKNPESDANEKMIRLVLGEKQANDLIKEISEEAVVQDGSENYVQNVNAIIFGLMSVLYDRPYETFEAAVSKAQSGEAEKK